MFAPPTPPTKANLRRYDAGVPELCEFLGVSDHTARRLVARGEVPYVRIGRQLRFRLADVEAALNSRSD